MKITRVTAWPIRIPNDEMYLGPRGTQAEGPADSPDYFLRPPYESLYAKCFEGLFVSIETDTGLVAWGEALAPVAPQVPATIVRTLLAPILEGRDPMQTQVLHDQMYGIMRERGHWSGFMQDAIAACDVALWDLKGKVLGEPVYNLLGGAFRREVPIYVSGLPRPTTAERIAYAKSWIDQGFTRFKVHAGWGVAKDLAEAEALRAGLGPEVELFWDAHWRYSRPEALQLAAGLSAHGYGLLETPLAPENYREYGVLRPQVDIAIALGEAERSAFAFREALMLDAVDVLQPDIGRTGLTEGMRIVQLARTFGKRVGPHLSTGLGVCIAASLHLAAAAPNLWLLEFQPTTVAVANRLLEEPLEYSANTMQVPDGPGLGVQINEDLIKKLRIQDQ